MRFNSHLSKKSVNVDPDSFATNPTPTQKTSAIPKWNYYQVPFSRSIYERIFSQDVKCLVLMAVLILVATFAAAQEPAVFPLKPVDRSSPRTALNTFLESGDELAMFLSKTYLPSPSRENFNSAASIAEKFIKSLDLSKIPPATQMKTGRNIGVYLYEVICRMPLSSFEHLPDDKQMKEAKDVKTKTWVIPNSEITLVLAESGPQAGQYLFSVDSVNRAEAFYEMVRGLPYTRPVPLEKIHDVFFNAGGWMIPPVWIQALPSWLQVSDGELPRWKWLGLSLIFGGYILSLWIVHCLVRMGRNHHPLLQALGQLLLPICILLLTPFTAYLALMQIYVGGPAASTIEFAVTIVMYFAGIWLSWRVAPVVAEAIITSPSITSESLDAHFIRLSATLFGLLGGAVLFVLGCNSLGIPLYGVLGGLGVGGIAVALAAQPTIENLIGSAHIFADKPVRVGDYCQYGDQTGTVESIGMRSTRIRTLDRKLSIIPNAELAKIPIVNFSKRDKSLVKSVVGLRYETTTDQLRYVLEKLREMLLAHPHVKSDLMRVRFIGFGESSLDIELFAFVVTSDWYEFLAIREDILLQVMNIIEQSGASIAFPSRTLYLGQNQKPDQEKIASTEALVHAWQEER